MESNRFTPLERAAMEDGMACEARALGWDAARFPASVMVAGLSAIGWVHQEMTMPELEEAAQMAYWVTGARLVDA